MPEAIRNYSRFVAGQGAAARLRDMARTAAIAALSARRDPKRTSGWIRFPYYHHVFDDERQGFARHLRYFKNIGDIIGIDDAVDMLAAGAPLDGRYICITFDDGFKNWIENALPILVEADAVAAFFVATDYIGTDPEQDRDKLLGFYDDGTKLMEFLNWDDCRAMTAAGMTIGSHSAGHLHLLDLDDAAAERELAGSKLKIESEIGQPCRHFCCPFGQVNIDYDPAHHPQMAGRVGYHSFLTTQRGSNRQGRSRLDIHRDHLLANWGNYQLRYFLGA